MDYDVEYDQPSFCIGDRVKIINYDCSNIDPSSFDIIKNWYPTGIICCITETSEKYYVDLICNQYNEKTGIKIWFYDHSLEII